MNVSFMNSLKGDDATRGFERNEVPGRNLFAGSRRSAGDTELFHFTYLCVRHASKAPKGSWGGHGFSSSLEE